MLHTKVRGNKSPGFREDFWRGFILYGHGGNLGHVTSIMSINFYLLVHSKFCSECPVISEKSQF